MNKIVGVIIFMTIVISGVFVSYMVINSNENSKTTVNSVTVIQNEFNSDETKTINITNKEDIKNIEKIYNKLLKMDTEAYDLALIGTTDIILNGEITIMVQLDNSDLCKYTGLGFSEFVETPQELIDWINKVL